MAEKHEFHWADYVVFSLSLLLSLGIGFFFACYGKKQSDTKEYLQGGGNMNPVAVGLSIAASLLNAVFLIGVPAEIYYFGMIYSLIGVAWVVTTVIAAHVFIPFFRHSSHVSVYEYLGVRFNSVAVRILASLTFSVSIVLFLAVVLYAPALAFEAVTGLSIHITQILCGAVCTLYVVMGGLKAVVWTDAVQMMIVMGGTLTIAIMGADKVGGADEVWKIAKEDNRVNYDITDHDPTTRHTIWTQCIGQIFIWLPVYGANQMAIQRYYAVASTFQAQVAIYVSLAVVIIILGMVTMCGLVMYANFRDCDPYRVEKVVDQGDQLFPLLLMRLLGDYHGLPGLYVAAVFAAALSSVSSAVNSLAAVVLEDFIKPVYEMTTGEKNTISEKTATRISQGLSLCFGLLTIALSYVAPYMGDELIQIPTTIWGSIMAPLFGVFILAMFFPCANASGAICGLLVTLTFSLWLTLGEILYGRDAEAIMPIGFCLPDGGAGGASDNMTMYNGTTEMFTQVDVTTTPAPPPRLPKTTEEPDLQDFYSVSYAWYGLINLCMSVLIGLVVSWCVDGIYYGCFQKPDNMEAEQMFDCAARCCCCLPHRYWHWFRCNIDHDEQAEALDFSDKPKANGSKYAPDDDKNAMSFGGANGQADNPGFMPDSSTSPAPDSQTAF